MDLLNDILASQQAGSASNFDGIDNYLKGAQSATEMSRTKEANNILTSRDQSNQLIANGDLVGALRNAQANGDMEYANNLTGHLAANRQQLASIAQNLSSLPQEHRAAALQAANATLNGTDVNTSSLQNADTDALRAIAAANIAPEQQIKNNQVNRSQDIDQQNANTNVFNSQTSRINSGTEQQNADTSRQRLGIDAQHYQNSDQLEADRNNIARYNATHVSLAPGSSIVTLDSAPTGTTLADRNNNPGNLVFAGQPGATRDSSGYASFQNPQDGIDANVNQIDRDINVHGYNTIDKFVDHWASTSSPAERRAYKGVIMRGTNKGINDTLTSDDIPKIFPLVAKQEGYSGTLNGTPSGTLTPAKSAQMPAVNTLNPVSAPIPNPAPATPNSSNLGLTTPSSRGQVGSVQSYYQPGVGNVITNVAPTASRDAKQDDAQRRSAALWQGALQADQVMSNAENNGNTPNDHQILSRSGTTIRSLSDEGQALNRYNDAAQRLAMEYANMYFGQGVSTKQMDEAANSITIKPTDSADQVNDKIANRKNMLNYLQQATHVGESVTPATLTPGYVNPLTATLPSREDITAITKAYRNRDTAALQNFRNKYGRDQLARFIEAQ